MFDVNSKSLFLIVFIIFSIQICNCSEFVPVFMWETQNTVQPSPALQKISEKAFEDLLFEKLKTNPLVVVFAEETLSPEDFAQHNENGMTSFKALHKLLASTNVGYKPYVQNPIGAVKQLEKGVTEISIASLLRNFDVPKDEVLIVDLNDAKEDEERVGMLRRHDTAIFQIFEKLLEKTDNILAIYTAHHTSWVTPEEVKHRNARDLLQQNETTAEESRGQKKARLVESPSQLKATATTDTGDLITDSDYVLLHVLSEPLYSTDGSTFEKINLTTSLCNKSDTVIDLYLSNTEKALNFQFTINLQTDGYWVLSSVLLADTELSVPEIVVPMGFSYHCFNSTFKSDKHTLILPGIQLQPFKSGTEHTFDDPYNCVGFTSIPIWSGILVTVVLLLILTFGITLMMDIRTMDKFDDAKGKSITINVSE